MTTFQMALIGFGVALVLGVVAYNWLQERRYRQEVNRLFTPLEAVTDSERPAPVESEAERIEPRIAFDEADPSAGDERQMFPDEQSVQAKPAFEVASEIRAEPRLESSPEPELAQQAAHAPQVQATAPAAADFQPESALDPESEYIARLRFSQPAMAPAATLIDLMRQIGKPVRIMGQREDGQWEPVAGPSRNRYTALELGLQLVDRSGAASSGQIEAFCRALYNFAAEQGGAVSCPDKYAALERAATLDGFCIEVDVLIGLNIVAPDARPFLMSEVHRCAGQAALGLQADGTYAVRDEAGRVLYALANQAAEPFHPDMVGATTHGITLLFDVPTVADGLAVFDRMAEVAQRLTKSLGGRLVDDNGKLVTQDSLQKIRHRLAEAYASMDARGIPAGGERASRLFV